MTMCMPVQPSIKTGYYLVGLGYYKWSLSMYADAVVHVLWIW